MNEDRIDEAVLALLYLNVFEHRPVTGARAWKSLDWAAMGRLHDQGLSTGSPAAPQRRDAMTKLIVPATPETYQVWHRATRTAPLVFDRAFARESNATAYMDAVRPAPHEWMLVVRIGGGTT